MKFIYVNWDWRNEFGSNRHSYEHYFSSSESKAWKKCSELWLKKHIWFSYIYSHTPLWGFIWNQHNDQLPVGLLAQLVERCTSIALVLGPNLVQAWIFFRSYFHYHWSSVHNCKDGFHLCVKCSILGRFILLVHNISKQIPCCVSVQKLIKDDIIHAYSTAECVTKFDVFRDLLLDTPITTMNPFFSCNKEQKTGNADVVLWKSIRTNQNVCGIQLITHDFISTVIPVVQCLHTLPTVFPPLLQRVAGKVPVPICWKMNH